MSEVATETFTPTAEKPIFLTPPCIDKLRELIAEEGNPSLKLRCFIQGGGCSGFSYGFTLDEIANEDDTVVDYDGVTVLVDSMSIQYLSGATVNFKDDLSGSSFLISNPNATSTCGCGSSFST